MKPRHGTYLGAEGPAIFYDVTFSPSPLFSISRRIASARGGRNTEMQETLSG